MQIASNYLQNQLNNSYQPKKSDNNDEDSKSKKIKHKETIVDIKNKEKPKSNSKEDLQTKREVAKLQSAERKIIAHEMAHMSAGGKFAGSPSYSYTQGPNGKKYITGGEVPIKIIKGKTPEETIQNMEQVKRAALAPANPSPQDMSVASKASQIKSSAAAEKNKEITQPDKKEKDSNNSIIKEDISQNENDKKQSFNAYDFKENKIENRFRNVEAFDKTGLSIYA